MINDRNRAQLKAASSRRTPQEPGTRNPVFFLLLAVVLLLSSETAFAQKKAAAGKACTLTYRVGFSDLEAHLFDISIEIGNIREPAIEVAMPAWSPGRYAIYDFAKNVQEFTAQTRSGEVLPCGKIDKQTWRIQTRGARDIKVSYRVFGNDLSGTFSVVNRQHANYNGASIFAYVVNHKPDPIHLIIDPPAGWKVMNGAVDTDGQREFDFANYDLLIDTPTEISSELVVRTFEVDGKTYRVAMNQPGGVTGDIDTFVKQVEQIVRAQTATMGTPDYKHYTFLMNFDPTGRASDGMEHLNSTQVCVSSTLETPHGRAEALETASHEFFHVWNVKRLRPVELGPWDYSREVHTRSLWIAEGLTSYYGDLFLGRSGVYSPEQMYQLFAGQISYFESLPGRKLMSVEQSSWDTWFIVGAPSRQETSLGRTSVNYYNKGEILGLLLDLEIRGRTNGAKSLDDVFRSMFKAFYEQPAATYYLKGKGYRTEDFLTAVNKVSGTDFSDFFERYIRGVEPLDYNGALKYVGLELIPGRQWLFRDVDQPTPKQLWIRKGWLTGVMSQAVGK